MEIIFIIAVIIIIVVYMQRRNKLTTIANNKPEAAIEPTELITTKNKVKWGNFQVTGYHHLPEEVKKIVWKQLKVGDDLELIPDLINGYDNTAIKVMFQDNQIGWVDKELRRKNYLFNVLKNNIKVSAKCSGNYRAQDGGVGGKKYLGMAQFVEVKYEIPDDIG